ncbi:hypothetical protein [Streptomyces sp. NBC_01207]|uniref:hypothetical protein n=1 Tax=Streptomyces sp. NBC_01207 TaxID=2903772 RepID=UPI002E11FE14|nr:hypothetical protein OG457_05225 [Streptomyces sp. NBC_01207]
MRQVAQQAPQMTATAVDDPMARSAAAEHPDVTPTVGPKIEKARIVVGYGAAVATLPYLLLKVIWVCGNLFAANLVSIAPIAGLSAQDTVGKDPEPFLASRVYVVVYGGFAIQGRLLAAAFVLYARHRWRVAFRVRSGETFPGATHPVRSFLAAQ